MVPWVWFLECSEDVSYGTADPVIPHPRRLL